MGRARGLLRARSARGLTARFLVVAMVLGVLAPIALSTVAPPAGAVVGDILTLAGDGTGAFKDGVAAGNGELKSPPGVTLDAAGNVLVADGANQRIRVVARSSANPGYALAANCSGACTWTPGDIFTIAGTGTAGYNGDGIAANSANLKTPPDLAVDASGNVIVADQVNNRVRVIAVSGSNPGYPLAGCGGSCTWNTGNIFTIAGTGTAGYNGDGIASTSAQLNGPGNVTVDPSANVLITDTAGQRLRVLAMSAANPGYPLAGCGGSCTWTAGDIFTIAGTGTAGYNGDGIASTSARLNNPHGATVDSAGDVLVADLSNARVRVLAVSGSNPGYPLAGCGGSCTWTAGDIFTIAGTGTAGYNNDGGTATAAQVNAPNDVALDHSGDVLVADLGNNRVRVIAVSNSNPGYTLAGCVVTCSWSNGDIFTVAGTGVAGFNGDAIDATTAKLNLPSSVTVENNGNLLIADESNNRIREVVLDISQTIEVPAQIPNPGTAGYDTGYVVDNAITLSASGEWCNISTECEDANGDGSQPLSDNTFLLPNSTRFTLVGRIGSSGPWTLIGTGPVTMNGSGELFLAMNDKSGTYDDNLGTMTVTIDAAMQLTTAYSPSTPQLGSGPIPWEGDMTNTGPTTITNAHFFAAAAPSLSFDRTDTPTWQETDGEFGVVDSGTCVPLAPSVPLYDCVVSSIAPGESVAVDENVLAQGLTPQTVSDIFALERSDQTPACFIFCSTPAPSAPTASKQIDGLQFNITAPATINAGDPLTISGGLTNTSATQDIHGITSYGTIDKGSITSAPPGCSSANNSPLGTGGSERCLATGTFDLAAGTSSTPSDTVIDTTGLAGKTIHYTAYATSPDLGGSTEIVSGSVAVTQPGMVINTPLNNAVLGRSLNYDFTATPTPTAGDNITSVDLEADSTIIATIPAPGPYTTTIASFSLAVGTHSLTAVAHQDNGGADLTKSITVKEAAVPAVSIVPPSGFASGGTLDTPKTFTATATAGTPATVKSVAWSIDSSINVPSAATAPYTATVNPAIQVLSAGTHTLTATVTDSLGQTKTSTGFDFNVPTATLQVPTPITPVASSITATGQASWTVQVNNTASGAIAHHVALRVEAFAGSDPTPIDLDAIDHALKLPNGSPHQCRPDTGDAVLCTIGEIPATSGVTFPVYTISGITAPATITADVVASAANAVDTSPQNLDPVNVIDCGTSCAESAVGPGTVFASSSSPPTETDPAREVVVLSPKLKTAPHLFTRSVRFLHPFSLQSWLPHLQALTGAIDITLTSIDPSQATGNDLTFLCNTNTPCEGKISEFNGDFSAYVDKTDPIVGVISANWGSSLPPAGHIWMEKDTGGSAIELLNCTQNATTRAFVTPCVLPEVVKSLTTNTGTVWTTYDLVLFTGADPHFARR